MARFKVKILRKFVAFYIIGSNMKVCFDLFDITFTHNTYDITAPGIFSPQDILLRVFLYCPLLETRQFFTPGLCIFCAKKFSTNRKNVTDL
jgi:hypothetical protein